MRKPRQDQQPRPRLGEGEESTTEATHPPSPCCLPGAPKTSPKPVPNQFVTARGDKPRPWGGSVGAAVPRAVPTTLWHPGTQDTPLGTLCVSGTVNGFKLLILNDNYKNPLSLSRRSHAAGVLIFIVPKLSPSHRGLLFLRISLPRLVSSHGARNPGRGSRSGAGTPPGCRVGWRQQSQ